MIRVARVRKPREFEKECGKPGRAWLERKPRAGKRPPAYWSRVKPHLADGFGNLCGYCAMYTPSGTVDHYRSWKNRPDLAYEWGNYRFASGLMNASKQNEDERVLDPYEVSDDWFEILLPSLQMVLTDRVPARTRKRAEHTLIRLGLRDDERVLRQRRVWYRMFQEGVLTLEGLEQMAPLIARAVRKTGGA